MVSILLAMIRATREGNWEMYKAAIRSVIPWCFSYDHLNYAKYLPIYLADMMNLEEQHPDVHQAFADGNFSIQMNSKNPFGRIPVDQAIEESVNKDTQGCSGTIGFSKHQAAVDRFYLNSDIRASFLQLFKEFTNREHSGEYKHPDLSSTRIDKDRTSVNKLVTLMEKEWSNPFDELPLLNIATGVLASTTKKQDLLHAHAKGEGMYQKYKSKYLSDECQTYVPV